jgi:predicted alpha/beta-hydrolase family hydrolase
MFQPFEDRSAEPMVRGFLHKPAEPNGNAVVLAHGAGANCQSKLLVETCKALAESGFTALRFDLPFRMARSFGPPRPGAAEHDREGLRRAAAILRAKIAGRVFLGGHSYGGRQATMLVAEDPEVADGLLLLSYPLHPPKKPSELRTKHFPNLTKPALFVHGTRDLFGTIEEMKVALKSIPATPKLIEIDGAGHELLRKKSDSDLPARIAQEFRAFVTSV